jgi:hypothetical protein
MAPDLGLSIDPTFDKTEATAVDIILILKAVWYRRDELGFEPSSLDSFWYMCVEGSIAGFRNCAIKELLYKDIELVFARDPADPSRGKLAITPTIPRVKRKFRIREKSQNM